MIKKIYLILSFLILAGGFGALKAQDPLPVDKALKQAVIDSITARYTPWNKVTASGRLSSPLLPISVNAKLYMEKDKLTQISLSVAFVGEVARIEIDDKEVLIVNKAGGKYIRWPMDKFRELYPGGQSELQSLLLGRVSLLGRGQLTKNDSSRLEIYDTYPQYWALLPNSDFQQPGLVYLYSVERGTLNLSQFALLSEEGDAEMTCLYEWGRGGEYTVDMNAAIEGKSFSGQLKLGTPGKADRPLERFTPDSKYTQVSSLRQLMR